MNPTKMNEDRVNELLNDPDIRLMAGDRIREVVEFYRGRVAELERERDQAIEANNIIVSALARQGRGE